MLSSNAIRTALVAAGLPVPVLPDAEGVIIVENDQHSFSVNYLWPVGQSDEFGQKLKYPEADSTSLDYDELDRAAEVDYQATYRKQLDVVRALSAADLHVVLDFDGGAGAPSYTYDLTVIDAATSSAPAPHSSMHWEGAAALAEAERVLAAAQAA